jgi:hypothetical protein
VLKVQAATLIARLSLMATMTERREAIVHIPFLFTLCAYWYAIDAASVGAIVFNWRPLPLSRQALRGCRKPLLLLDSKILDPHVVLRLPPPLIA